MGRLCRQRALKALTLVKVPNAHLPQTQECLTSGIGETK